MSDRYYRPRYRSLSPEPYYIERLPRYITRSPSPHTVRSSPGPRRVSFGVATDPRSKKTVVFKESTYRRKRRSSRRSRTASPPPAPRGRNPLIIMSDRAAEEHVPLPPPVRKEGERSSSSEDGDGKRKERRRKGKSYDKRAPLVHNPLDEDYPVIEDTSTPSSDRRDSGVFSGRGSPRNAKYHETKGKFLLPAERRSPVDDSHVQELTQQFNHILQNEHLDKLNAEARANRLEEQLNRAKAEIDQNKRADYLDQRERRISDREKSHRDEQKRLSQTSLRGNLPPPRRDVVVTQPQLPIQPSGGYYATPPPAADPAAEALAKAKSDWNKRKSGGGYGDRRRSP